MIFKSIESTTSQQDNVLIGNYFRFKSFKITIQNQARFILPQLQEKKERKEKKKERNVL